MPQRVRKKTASLNKLVDPEFVTVVKSPANKTGFKLVRADNKAESVIQQAQGRVRKKIRSDSTLLSIDLPEGVDQGTAEEIMRVFGLVDDYEVVQNGELYSLNRKGSDDSVKTLPIDLGDGIVAHVAAQVFSRNDKAQREDRPGVRLVRIDFNEEHFPSVGSVKEWLDKFEIDFKGGGVETIGDGFSVTRHDTDAEAKRLVIGKGVTGVIVRSSETDVPIKIYRSVVDQAYGNYGWGHIDFAAALADPEFTDKSWDALWALRDVLENVVFYSGLSLDDRKVLIKHVCDQYAVFMVNLMDALPAGVIEQVKNSDSNLLTKQENTMSTKTTKTGEEKNVEEKEGTKAQVITREDVATMISDAFGDKLNESVSAGVNAAFKRLVEREDGGDKGESAGKDEDKSGDDAVLKAIQGLATRMDGMETSVKGLKKDVDDIGDETEVTRSDDDATEGGTEAEKKAREDHPFVGMFSHLGIGNAASQ